MIDANEQLWLKTKIYLRPSLNIRGISILYAYTCVHYFKGIGINQEKEKFLPKKE